MLYDFIIINKKDKTPLYRQIYMSVRKSIETGSLKKGTKLPSIRRLSTDLDVSKTTVNGAYEQLCAEGYISNRPRSGYYVEAQFSGTPSKSDKMSSNINKTKRYYEYDFSSKSIDDGIININEWKKYVCRLAVWFYASQRYWYHGIKKSDAICDKLHFSSVVMWKRWLHLWIQEIYCRIHIVVCRSV